MITTTSRRTAGFLSRRKLGGAIASAAMLSGVLFAGTGPAHAEPCWLWGFPADTAVRIEQSGGWVLGFNGQGLQAFGSASAISGRSALYGTVKWRSNYNSQIRFTTYWNNGSQGEYTGTAGSNGYATGTTYDAKNPSSKGTWKSTTAFKCVL